MHESILKETVHPLANTESRKPAGFASRATSAGLLVKQVAGVGQMRVLVGLGLVSLVYFVVWFASSDPIGYAPLFWLLTVSLGFKMLRMLHEWYHYVNVTEPLPPTEHLPAFTVDVLTTACPGEPYAMIVQTLEAMQAITYPHTSYLCDEGDDPYLRAVCQQLGVVHVTRKQKVNAKAGNINNALQQATGELCVVLDPDHVPTPDFLDYVVPYFTNASVGYVQVVQAYGNQKDSLVALGAAEQTYHFYGPLMMGMNSYNTTQAIGANCTFRRAALDSIGGHAAGLTEDMHTAMRLHAAGWQSVYVPRVLSRGLVPSTLGAFYAQQLKWARGAFELLFEVYPRLVGRLSWRQRLHYLTLPLYFLSGLITLIDLAVPIASLGLSVYPWHISLAAFALHLMPLLGISLLIRYKAQAWLREPHETGLHLAGGILRVGTWWIYLLGFVYTIFRVRVPYIPTPKEGNTRNEFRIALPNIMAILLCAVAVKYAGRADWSPYSRLMAFLATCNAGILLAAVGMGQHTWMRTLTTDLQSQPLRGIVQAFRRAVTELTTRAQTRGVSLAIGSLAVVGCVDAALFIQAQSAEFALASWLLDGGDSVRVGTQHLTLSTAEPAPDAFFSGQRLLLRGSTDQAASVSALPMMATLPKADIIALHRQGVTPLLNWQVAALPVSKRQQLAQAIHNLHQPIMLQPIFPALSAPAYRKAWQEMVREFKANQVTNVVWVWMPPSAAAVQSYFPGKDYVDWVAAPYKDADTSPTESLGGYSSYRHEFAMALALHDKPVLLLVNNAMMDAQQLVHRIGREYPEVKAVIFPARHRPNAVSLRTNKRVNRAVMLSHN